MKKKFLFLIAFAIGCFSPVSHGATFNYTDLTNLTNQITKDVLENLTIYADHRPYRPATPLGVLLGIEIGVEGTFTQLGDSFQSGLSLIGNSANVPAYLPLPRVHFRKGFPFGVDLGLSYIGFQGDRIIGGDVQWALPIPLLDLALRFSFTDSRVDFLKVQSWAVDAVASLSFFLFEPYVGVGFEHGSGSLEVPLAQIPINVSAEHSFNSMRVFAGFPLELFVLRITPEVDYSFLGFVSFGVKAAVEF